MVAAIPREKSLERYKRNQVNPRLNDLYTALTSRRGVHGWPGQRPGHDEDWDGGAASRIMKTDGTLIGAMPQLSCAARHDSGVNRQQRPL
jgi:hypothetical protein